MVDTFGLTDSDGKEISASSSPNSELGEIPNQPEQPSDSPSEEKTSIILVRSLRPTALAFLTSLNVGSGTRADLEPIEDLK